VCDEETDIENLPVDGGREREVLAAMFEERVSETEVEVSLLGKS
jgi:hypothetical protein